MDIPEDVLDAMGSASDTDWKILRDHIDAQNAEIAQHAAMMAKLRQMSKQMNTSMHKVVAAYGVALDTILSAEPAEPRTLSDFVNLPPADKQRVGLEVAEMATEMQRGAKVDIEAVREVMNNIACFEGQDSLRKTWASRLAAAIGEE